MTKKELIAKIIGETDYPENTVADVVNQVFDSIKQAVKSEETVNISGFGLFNVIEKAERNGRNPKTGEPVKIAARKFPHFKPSKTFKHALNGKE